MLMIPRFLSYLALSVAVAIAAFLATNGIATYSAGIGTPTARHQNSWVNDRTQANNHNDSDRASYETNVGAAASAPLSISIESVGAATEERDEPGVPMTVSIDRLGISTEVQLSGADSQGVLVVDAGTASWYHLSAMLGQEGATLVAGHVAWSGSPGVFHSLADAQPGDLVDVEADTGKVYSYEVNAIETIDKDALPVERITRRSGPSELVLVTCGGAFNSGSGHYDDNIIVTASLVP